MANNEEMNVVVQVKEETKKFDLPSGKRCEILKGKGVHARNAAKHMDGDSSKYMNLLMAQLVLINGQGIVMEDLDEMDLQDYLAIQAEFADQNFSSPQGT